MPKENKENKDKDRSKSILPASVSAAILMIAVLMVEIVLVMLVAIIDILPVKYLMLMLSAIVVIDIIALLLISNRFSCRRNRIIGMIICGLMIVAGCLGVYYLYNAYDTMTKITSITEKKVEYCVIVSQNSPYEDVSQIKGMTVYTAPNSKKTYKEASGMLVTKADVKYEKTNSPQEAMEKITGSEGSDANVVFLSRAEYNLLDEEMPDVGKKTEVLYSIKVPERENDNSSKIDVTKDSFNFLISGIDSRTDVSDDFARSDVNMIVTVNPKTHTILLTSMPRDSYVPLHMNGQMDKLTHTGVYGVEETIATIEDWLNIKIDFYARVDFHMLQQLITAVKGVDVYNNIDFYSHPKGWHYKKGMIHLYGRTALWFVRERKSFEDEDEQRIRNQQKVVKAVIKKVTSSKTLVANYGDILAAVENNMQTNMSREDMSKLAKMQLEDMPEWKIEKQWVDGEDSEAGTWSMGPNRMLFVSIPHEDSVKKVTKKINSVMYPVKETE